MSGKGDNRRPTAVSQGEVDRNWDRIFGKEKPAPAAPDGAYGDPDHRQHLDSFYGPKKG